jgi:type I site-specific restriction-modification system R (restriction) subunit
VNLLGHLKEVNNLKQMALDELIPNTMDVVEPKAKKKYKTKKEKEKDITMEKLVVMVQTMVNDEFHDEEAQSLKDLVEKTMKAPPQKTKNKKIGKDEVGMNKAKAHEITPSLVM